MNILQVQDDLKNFSQQQLVQEMKQPKGVAPQFLVLGEITRRKRMSDDMKTRGSADQNTVAQDVVSAAGVPQGGLAQMAQAMAPKSSIEPNMQPQGQAQPQAPMPMASGGILSLAGGGGKTKREKAFFLEFPKNSPIFAGERRYVTANTLEQLESSMPLFFKRMRSRGEVIANENAPEAFQKTATKLAPAQLNIAMRRGKENIAQAEQQAEIESRQAETGATNDQAVTSAGRSTESQVIDDVQSLDAPVAEPSEYDIQQDSDIEGDLLMADDYEKAEKERLRQEALATGLVPSETTDMIRNQETGVRPFSGSAFPNLADERPYPDRVKPTFNARSDEAAAASLAEIQKINAEMDAFNEQRRKNALAYKEGRTPAQENVREDARGIARDSAITALGEIDRSNEPVGFRQIMENKALQQAAIAQDNPNMFGDLGAPNTMQEELARKAAEDEAAKEAQAEAQLQSYLRNMEAPTDMIGGIQESDLVRKMRTSNEKNVARAMRLKAKEDEMNSLRLQAATDQSIEGAAPIGNYSQIIDDLSADTQKREAAEAIALKDATEMSIDTASPIGNYGQVAADALRADVDVGDARLGGAFAKGDEGIKRKLRGFGPFEDSTSELIQDQLKANAINDEVDRVKAAEADRLDDRRIMQDAVSGADKTRAIFGDQAYDSIALEELPKSIGDMASDFKDNLIANAIEGPNGLKAGVAQVTDFVKGKGPEQVVADRNYAYMDAARNDPNTFASEMVEKKPFGFEDAARFLSKATGDKTKGIGDALISAGKSADTSTEGLMLTDAENKAALDDVRGEGMFAPSPFDEEQTLSQKASNLATNADYFLENQVPSPSEVGTKIMSVLPNTLPEVGKYLPDFGKYFDGNVNEQEEAIIADSDPTISESNLNPDQEQNKVGSSIITEMDEQAALDSQSNAAFEAERQRQIAAKNKGSSKVTGGTGSSASSQILDLLKSQEANADSDKWMALANAGMALMSSKQPTLGGALGEAGQVGIAGLMKSRQAGDAAKLKTLKFQAGIEAAAAKAGKSGLSSSNMVSLINSLSGDNARIATEIAKLEAKSTDGMSLEPQDDAYLKSLRLMLTSNLVDIQGYRRQAGLAALPKTQDVRTATS